MRDIYGRDGDIYLDDCGLAYLIIRIPLAGLGPEDDPEFDTDLKYIGRIDDIQADLTPERLESVGRLLDLWEDREVLSVTHRQWSRDYLESVSEALRS